MHHCNDISKQPIAMPDNTDHSLGNQLSFTDGCKPPTAISNQGMNPMNNSHNGPKQSSKTYDIQGLASP